MSAPHCAVEGDDPADKHAVGTGQSLDPLKSVRTIIASSPGASWPTLSERELSIAAAMDKLLVAIVGSTRYGRVNQWRELAQEGFYQSLGDRGRGRREEE